MTEDEKTALNQAEILARIYRMGGGKIDHCGEVRVTVREYPEGL